MTLPIIILKETMGSEAWREVKGSVFQDLSKTKAHLENHNVYEKCLSLAESYTNKAYAELDFLQASQTKEHLFALVDTLIWRKI